MREFSWGEDGWEDSCSMSLCVGPYVSVRGRLYIETYTTVIVYFNLISPLLINITNIYTREDCLHWTWRLTTRAVTAYLAQSSTGYLINLTSCEDQTGPFFNVDMMILVSSFDGWWLVLMRYHNIIHWIESLVDQHVNTAELYLDIQGLVSSVS